MPPQAQLLSLSSSSQHPPGLSVSQPCGPAGLAGILVVPVEPPHVAAWLEEVQGFWEKPRGSVLSHAQSNAPAVPHGLEKCLPFAQVLGNHGLYWKERGFGLLRTSWGSEGCSQSDQQACEVSWGCGG